MCVLKLGHKYDNLAERRLFSFIFPQTECKCQSYCLVGLFQLKFALQLPQNLRSKVFGPIAMESSESLVSESFALPNNFLASNIVASKCRGV